MTTGIIVAAGKSERMGNNLDKAFLALGPRPVVAWSLLAFQQCAEIDRIILVVRKDQLVAAKGIVTMFGLSKVADIIQGGTRRQDSVLRGLNAADPDTRFVLIHDGARPCVTSELISATIQSARKHGSGVAANRITDTLKISDRNGIVSGSVDRTHLWAMQTPQAFKFPLIKKAYDALPDDTLVTDDASAVGLLPDTPPVRLVEWNKPNIKITTVEDLSIAAALLRIHG